MKNEKLSPGKVESNLPDEKDLKKEKQRKLLMVIGPLIAVLLGKPSKESLETRHEFKPSPESKISVEGKMPTLEDEKKAIERMVAEHEMQKDASNLYEGTCQNENLRDLKGKLVMFPDIEKKVDHQLFENAKKVYEKGEDLAGQKRTEYMEDIMQACVESYANGQKNHLEHKNLEEITATSLATIHEYNTIFRAGSTEDQIRNQLKAGHITEGRGEFVKNALEESKESIKIDNLPKNLEINGQKVEISDESDLYQHIGKGMVKFPMKFLEGAQIDNLHNLKETDPQSYENYLNKYLDKYTNETINTLSDMGAEIDKDDKLTREIIKEKLKESAHSEGKEISFNLPDKSTDSQNEFKLDVGHFKIGAREYDYRLGTVETLNIGNTKINLPGIEVASKLKGEKGMDVSFDMKAMGGRINSRILCQGNMVKIIIPEYQGGMNEKEEVYAINALVLLALLPFVRLPKREREDEPTEGTGTLEIPKIKIPNTDYPETPPVRRKIPRPKRPNKPKKLTGVTKIVPPKYDESYKLKGMYKESPLVGIQHSRGGEASGGSSDKGRTRQGRERNRFGRRREIKK